MSETAAGRGAPTEMTECYTSDGVERGERRGEFGTTGGGRLSVFLWLTSRISMASRPFSTDPICLFLLLLQPTARAAALPFCRMRHGKGEWGVGGGPQGWGDHGKGPSTVGSCNDQRWAPQRLLSDLPSSTASVMTELLSWLREMVLFLCR